MAFKLDAGQQWLRDETNNELVGIKDSVDGEERMVILSVTSPTGTGVWTAAEFAAITPESGKFYLVEA